jgi:hypothetical protein
MYGFARHTGTWLVAVALLLGGMAGGVARADNPPVFIDEAGRAIDGYDTVAYFTDGQSQPGDTAYSRTATPLPPIPRNMHRNLAVTVPMRSRRAMRSRRSRKFGRSSMTSFT